MSKKCGRSDFTSGEGGKGGLTYMKIEVGQAGCNAKSGNKSFLDHFFGLGNRQEDTRKSLT
jgi:hypothetical protein